MPGWSTILRVDRKDLGLDDAPAPEPQIAPDSDPDDVTSHDTNEGPTPFEETTEPPVVEEPAYEPRSKPRLGGAAIEEVGAEDQTMANGLPIKLSELHFKEITESDDDAPQHGSPGDTLLDTNLASLGALLRPNAATSVQVEGVVGERLPAVITRRSLAALNPDALLSNAPIAHPSGAPPPTASGSSAELTQIHAAAALGIAPEPALAPSPNAPAALGGTPDRTPPPVLEKVDFGPLKLGERQDVMARYPVESHGLTGAERLAERAPGIVAVSKLLPILIMVGMVFAFLLTFLVGPIGDLMRMGERRTARQNLREATAKAAAAASEGVPLPKGAIRIITRPQRAAVEVDAYYVGRAPLLLAPPEERNFYDVKITLPNYRPWVGELRKVGSSYVIQRSSTSASRGGGELSPDGDERFQLTITLDPDVAVAPPRRNPVPETVAPPPSP